MDGKMILPFVEAFYEVLPAIGCPDVKHDKLSLKEKMTPSLDITAVVDLSEDLRGKIAYCMSEGTARNMASMMMMGAPVKHLDQMAQSAIAEMANIITSRASIAFSKWGLCVNISPPVLLTGENVAVMVSQARTFCIEMVTKAGIIEINIGLEI